MINVQKCHVGIVIWCQLLQNEMAISSYFFVTKKAISTFAHHLQKEIEMKKYTNLDEEDQNKLFGFLWAQIENGRLKWGAMAKAAKLFHVHRSTISHLWSVWLDEGASTPSKKENNGRPIKYNRERLRPTYKSYQSCTVGPYMQLQGT